MEEELIIRAVGDMLFPSKYEASSAALTAIEGVGSPAAMTLANLEVPLTRVQKPTSKFIAVRADPEWVRELRRWQVTAVSLANNHLLDQGVDAAWETAGHLDQAGIAHAGFGANVVEALDPAWLRVPSGEVAVISAAVACPPAYAASDSTPGVAAVRVATAFDVTERLLENPGQPPRVRTCVIDGSLEPLLESIRRARSRAAAVVVALHWGVPQQAALADYQQPLAHAVIDAGADVIVGHHPHVLQGVEIYRGSPILYSLGHLVCGRDQIAPLTAEIVGAVKRQWHISAVARIRRSASGTWGVEFIPVAIGEEGLPRRCDSRDAEAVLDALALGSEQFGVQVFRDAETIRVAVPEPPER